MATQALWCQPGAHSWTRPAQRGRKPVACPQHVAQAPTVYVPGVLPGQARQQGQQAQTESGYEVLTCETGNHSWKRPTGRRGRKPRFCPDHAPVVAVSSSSPVVRDTTNDDDNQTETLHCHAGNHDWQRVTGKRGKKPQNCPEHTNTTAVTVPSITMDEILVKYHPTDEDVRVLTYCTDQFKLNRDANDLRHLVAAFKGRLRSCGAHIAIPVESDEALLSA